MLFSNDDIASYINNSFEPAWMSVRSVPTVNIDFGDKQITRTLHGNIATYACTADGTVLDIMPGAYEPKTYFQRLQQFTLLHRWIVEAPDPAQRLSEYHTKQEASIRSGSGPQVLARQAKPAIVADFSKVARIELPVEVVLQPRPAKKSQQPPRISSDDPFATLAEDTRVNETTRRLKIHTKLAEAGMLAPGGITRWLYREVLDADLDDPYLGLGELLFDDYPFAEEERVANQ